MPGDRQQPYYSDNAATPPPSRRGQQQQAGGVSLPMTQQYRRPPQPAIPPPSRPGTTTPRLAETAFEGNTATTTTINPGMTVQPGVLLNNDNHYYSNPLGRPGVYPNASYQSVQSGDYYAYDDEGRGGGGGLMVDDEPLLTPIAGGRTSGGGGGVASPGTPRGPSRMYQQQQQQQSADFGSTGAFRTDAYGMPPGMYNDMQVPAYPPSNGAYADVPLPGSPTPTAPMGGWVPGGVHPAFTYPTSDDASILSGGPHYGRIPSRVPRRYKTTKRIELFRGNLVLDCPIPTKLLALLPEALRKEREGQVMRYTAATCQPDDWVDERYALRQELYEPKRRTELFICATMYNEDDVLFTRTMHGVFKNIAHLCSRDRSKMWGREGWKKIVVCIISDGREKINARTLACLAAMGAYQDGVAKNVVNGKPVMAHIYEYTTQISIDPELKFKGNDRGIVPVQLIFCLKEKNQKKINSHRWFFNAFARSLQPNICVLLDVGTMPGPRSIYHLWKTFDVNSSIGGACGEIVALKGKYGRNLLNPLVAAQNFEYKMSNILDKTTESVLGYITVLPGAFSAYRYIALQNDVRGKGPLGSYFLGENTRSAGSGVFEANMYLAEDRILCFEIVTKKKCSWLLHYVKNAYAVTDVPDAVPEWISQRRRWLNGSFFAAVHAVWHFHRFWTSGHNFARKIWLTIEMIYQLVNLIVGWFALGNFFIFFTIITSSLADPSFHIAGMNWVYTVLHWIYLALLVMIFVISLGNRPQGSKISYTFAMLAFALFMVWMIFATVFITYKGVVNIKDYLESNGESFTISTLFSNNIFRTIAISILSTIGLYILSSIVALDPWHMITSSVQYFLLAPSFVNILQPYAFCNTHDVTWGTKGDNAVKTDLGVVQGTKDSSHVDVIIPTEEKDINAAYDDACHVLTTKAPTIKPKRDAATKQEDYYKSVRTRVVLFYCLSNGLLIAVILSTGLGYNSVNTNGRDARASVYLSIILYSVAALAAFRFIVGSLVFNFFRIFTRS